MRTEPLSAAWRWLILFAGLTSLSLSFLAYHDWQQFHAQLNQRLARMDAHLDQANLLLQGTIAEAGRDTVALADLPVMASAFDNPAARGVARSALRRLIELHGDYMQTRLLDSGGQERIRFDRYRATVVETRPTLLQDKSHRYYIDAARRLHAQELYVSPIDLNVEHGEIERPLRPVIRLAAPVSAAGGTRLGFTIINYDISALFESLRTLFNDDIGTLLAVKPNGAWMMSRTPSLNWGVQLGHGARFDDLYESEWQQVNRSLKGAMRTPNGWLSYRRVDLHVAPDVRVTGQPTLGWLIVHAPPERLSWRPLSRVRSAFPALLILASVIALLALGITWLWIHLSRTQRRNAANARNLQLAGVIYDNADEALFVTDARQRIESVNNAASRITGFTPQELIGATPRLWRSGRHDKHFYTRLWRTIEREGQWSGEIINRRKSGELFPAWESITAVHGEDGNPVNYVSVMTDISDLKVAEDQLRHLAFHDPLSGLPNRMLFTNNLEQLVELCRRSRDTFAIAVIDLDHFKVVNDSLGHQAGDELIREIAQRLQHGSRREDTVARLGGDEFAIIMPGIDSAETCAAVMQRTIASVTQPFDLEGRAIEPECSVGLALFPTDGDDSTDLLKAADAAMYESKRRRKHECIFHSPELQARADTRMELEQALRRALDRDELDLRFQPQVDLETGRILGAEALVRWKHPQRGLVQPAEFLPIAEESALINRIGTWVAARAGLQARTWAEQGMGPLRIAINISGHQLNNPHGREALLEALAPYTRPWQLELELSETLFFEGDEGVAFLHMLRGKGVSIAMDNFGAGRSSLLQLRHLPIDRIKISGEFVRTMDTDAGARAIVRAMLELGRDLGIAVVAENVESAAQRDLLHSLGCREAQGYLFGPAMTASALAALLQRSTVPASLSRP